MEWIHSISFITHKCKYVIISMVKLDCTYHILVVLYLTMSFKSININ